MLRPRRSTDSSLAGLAVKNQIPDDGQALVWEKASNKLKFATVSGGTPAWGAITGTLSSQSDLQSALDGKAASSHTHAISSVTGLQAALDGKQASGSYAAASHTHAQSDITNLVSDLAGKAATSHSHSGSDITTGTVAPARLGSGTPGSGNYLRGDGQWVAVSGGGDLAGAGAPISGVQVNNATTYQTLASKTITLAAGDQIEFTLVGTYLNNSGGTITPRIRIDVGAFTCEVIDGTTIATSATAPAVFWINARASVASTSSAAMAVELLRFAPTAANTRGAVATTTHGASWNTSASNLTGSQLCAFMMRSSSATATQTFTVHSWSIRKTGAV